MAKGKRLVVLSKVTIGGIEVKPANSLCQASCHLFSFIEGKGDSSSIGSRKQEV